MQSENFESIEKISHKGVSQLSYEVTPFLQNDPNRSPLYALMVAINKGKKTREEIYNYFKYFYVNEFSYVKLTQTVLDELIIKGIKQDLIQRKGETFFLTEQGNQILIKAKKVILVSTRLIRLFFNEKCVLSLSLICLIFLSSLKILVGLNIGSDALFNEGIENFTDILKIFIIFLSIKFKKDKLGAIVIIILMLYTGVNLVISSFSSLISNQTIMPNYFSFILMFISILINFILLFLKNFVGRLSGNFALLSDAKDNLFNMRMSMGVIVGLIFAIFGFYYIDSLLGLFIASLIIFDGIKTLIELIKSGDNIEIDTFKLKIDESFEVKIVDWLLMTIQEEELSEEELNNRFIEAIEKGYEIFDIWAIFGLYDIKKFGVYKILNLMKKRRLIIEINGNISLTDKGEKYYDRIVYQEIKRVSREKIKYQDWRPPRKIIKILWLLLGFGLPIIIILLLIFVGPNLYNFIIDFLKG